MAVGLRS